MKKLQWKKLQWRKWMAAALLMAMPAILAGCGGSSSFKGDMNMSTTESAGSRPAPAAAAEDSAFGEVEWADDEGYFVDMPAESPMEPVPEVGEIVDNSAYYNDRKLIRTVNLDVETKEFEQMLATLEAQVAAMGGYIEDMYTYNGSSFSSYAPTRNASMTARIPKQQLSAFLNKVSSIGNVVSRSENVEDVTLSYVDMESRKDALKVEQERLMELLKKAEAMEDILNIEDRLAMVRYQLESMESQLRTYDNKVDFATVYLTINEVKELTPVEEETTAERIAHGFMDSLRNVGEGLVDFFVWIVVSIPYLVLWAVFIAVIVLIVRLCIRSSRKKKAKKLAQMQQAYAQSMQTQVPVVQPTVQQKPEVQREQKPEQAEDPDRV